MCVCVLYRRPHRWTYRAQIWHGGPHLPQGGYRIHFVPEHLPPPVGGGQRVVLEIRAAQTVHFCENFIKQKLQGTPDLVGAGHLFGPQIRIRKDLGPLSFWSHGYSL